MSTNSHTELELTSLRLVFLAADEYLCVAKDSFTEPELREALVKAVHNHEHRHGTCEGCMEPITVRSDGSLNGRGCSGCGRMIHYGCGCGRSGDLCSYCHEEDEDE